MSPNRELSDQIYQVYSELNKYMKTTGTLLIGGTAVDTCIKTIEKGAQVVIGTPGRIYDMLKRGILKTTHLKSMILDEADEMLSRGFQDQV